jgi:hypothetical protein
MKRPTNKAARAAAAARLTEHSARMAPPPAPIRSAAAAHDAERKWITSLIAS